MTERLSPTEFFDKAGLRRLTPDEETQVARHYKDELLSGLAGRPNSVAMYPSLLRPIEMKSLSEGRESLVIEVGGTNLYGARVKIINAAPVIVDHQKAELSGVVFESANDFYRELAVDLGRLFSARHPDSLSIVYSFPGKAVETTNGIGVMSPENLPKEFVIPGISRSEVSKAFLSALEDMYGFASDTPTVVLNDTVAVLLADEAKIGGVVGTGYNLAMLTEKGIVNSESGGFAIEPTHHFAHLMDKESNNPGKQLAEKQVAGRYLGLQLQIIAAELSRNGFTVSHDPKTMTAETISSLLEDQNPDPTNLMLKEAATRLRDRSAQIVGVMIATVIRTFPDVFENGPIKVPIEGSFFWKTPGYREEVLATIKRLAEREDVEFPHIEHAGRLGAAVASLSFVR